MSNIYKYLNKKLPLIDKLKDEHKPIIDLSNLKMGLLKYQRNFISKDETSAFFKNEYMGMPILFNKRNKVLLKNNPTTYEIDHKKFSKEIFNDPKFIFKEIHRDTEVIHYSKLIREDIFNYVYCKIAYFIQSINKNYYPNYVQIVKWPNQASQPEHKDFDYHPFTSIISFKDIVSTFLIHFVRGIIQLYVS